MARNKHPQAPSPVIKCMNSLQGEAYFLLWLSLTITYSLIFGTGHVSPSARHSKLRRVVLGTRRPSVSVGIDLKKELISWSIIEITKAGDNHSTVPLFKSTDLFINNKIIILYHTLIRENVQIG